MTWNDETQNPPENRVLLAYCPDWCESGYQVCYFKNGKFKYDEQPNDMFDCYVEKWQLIFEAD